MTQAELAARAGIGVNTVSTLEAGRKSALKSLARKVMVLGQLSELEALFMPKLESLDDIRRYEKSASRQRIKRRSDKA